MFRAFTDYQEFNHILGVTNVGELNDDVAAGKSPGIINESWSKCENRGENMDYGLF